MTRTIVVKPSAELDITEAFLWYEEQREGLGVDFVSEIDAVFARISSNAQSIEIKHELVRLAFTHRFPFAVHFLIEREKIIVLAVLHTSRDPKNWPKK